jgi:hypothetical protein
VAHYANEEGARVVRVGGSGIFVAPCQALTAKHVVEDLFRIDHSRSDEMRQGGPKYFVPAHCRETRFPFRNVLASRLQLRLNESSELA